MSKNNTTESNPRILIVGSFSARMSDARVSGTVVSLKHLVADLRKREDVSISILDTGSIRRNSLRRIFELLQFFLLLLKKLKRIDLIALHLSPNGFTILGPIIIIIAKVLKKPVLFRMFGGMDYIELPGLRTSCADWAVRRTDAFLVQSRSLESAAKERGINRVVWFPTTRPVPAIGSNNPYQVDAEHYVYAGQIKNHKGIFELIEAFKILEEKCKLIVYGPFYDGLDASMFANVGNIEYKGIAPPEAVPGILSRAKALVFPTYLREEGYSGIIIEAYSVGLPVLCSEWKFLPEIVDESSGILFAPRDPNAIVSAIRRFENDKDLRVRLSSGAFEKRLQFSIESGTERFLEECHRCILKSLSA